MKFEAWPRQLVCMVFKIEWCPRSLQLGKRKMRLETLPDRTGCAPGPYHFGKASCREEEGRPRNGGLMRRDQSGYPGPKTHPEDGNIPIPLALQPADKLAPVPYSLLTACTVRPRLALSM